MKVNLRLAEPNPYRDFRVDPVDPTNVAQLAKSIKEHGFWGGIVARRKPDVRGAFQIVAGWHRREAALKRGIEEADIFVGDFDDRQTVRAYADENATQRGNTSTAQAGSVAAALREILLRKLSSVDFNRTGGPTEDGVGRDAILEELNGVNDINDNVVRQQLAHLKATGAYDRIVNEVTAIVEAEREAELAALAEAEQRTREAAQREVEAKARREKAEAERQAAKAEAKRRETEALIAREAADKKRAAEAAAFQRKREAEAEERRKKAAEEAERAKAEREAAKAKEVKHAPAAQTRDSIAQMRAAPKHQITLNDKVARHFRSPHHVEVFKKLATGEKLLPVDQQERLAKSLVEMAKTTGEELTSTFIKEKFNDALIGAKFLQRIANATERDAAKAALERAGWEKKAKVSMSEFSRHARGVSAATDKLTVLYRSRPAGIVTLHTTAEFLNAVDSLRAALRIVEGKLI